MMDECVQELAMACARWEPEGSIPLPHLQDRHFANTPPLVGWLGCSRKSVHLLREKMGGSLMGWPTHSPSLACATIRSLDQVMAAQPGEVHRGAQTVVKARGSRLMDLHGVGPVVAARTLADVGDIARFADRNRFASC